MLGRRRDSGNGVDARVVGDEPDHDIGVEDGHLLVADTEEEAVAGKLVELRRNDEPEIGDDPATAVLRRVRAWLVVEVERDRGAGSGELRVRSACSLVEPVHMIDDRGCLDTLSDSARRSTLS